MSTYSDALKRLKEERCRLSMSQKEMGRCVRMTQSNYSKVELALRRLSYYELKYLCDTEVDVHYVFTAQKGNEQYTEFFDNCSYAELVCYLSIIYYVTVLCNREVASAQWEKIYEKIKYMPLIAETQYSNNILFLLRRSMNYQQQKMAEELGVDIKKFRDLENGRCLPDSELLYQLYESFGIPPAVVLQDKSGVISELSFLLGLMDEVSGKRVFEIIKILKEMK